MTTGSRFIIRALDMGLLDVHVVAARKAKKLARRWGGIQMKCRSLTGAPKVSRIENVGSSFNGEN